MNWKLTFVFFTFYISFPVIDGQNPIGLKVNGYLRNILLGSAIRVQSLRNMLDNGEYNNILTKNYQVVVPEAELKPRSIWIAENVYNWNDSDWLLGSSANSTGWIQKNQLKLRGHNLVWALDKWTPDWLLQQESKLTPSKALSLMSDYIHTVVSRYRGKIPWWDVVNEAIDDIPNTNPFNLRNCFWFRKLGPDFLKYAFIFAHEADPDLQLYYNDFDIETIGIKTNQTIALINWLRSQGAIVHGVGLQWHISTTTTIEPGDGHYRSAQQFVDQRLDFMITELDVSMLTIGGYPINSSDLELQGRVFRSVVQYALNFLPKCQAMLTWGFTDRYSWIPSFRENKQGAALPIDWMYLPKTAYWQMQEELGRVLMDGHYRLSPQLQPNKCLGVSNNGTMDIVKLFDEPCQNPNQIWNLTWLDDGTYRIESFSDLNNRVLVVYNATKTVDPVQVTSQTNGFDQEWAFSPQGTNLFRVVPRTAWWRVMTVYDQSTIAIVDYIGSESQNWIITRAELIHEERVSDIVFL